MSTLMWRRRFKCASRLATPNTQSTSRAPFSITKSFRHFLLTAQRFVMVVVDDFVSRFIKIQLENGNYQEALDYVSVLSLADVRI